MTKQERELAKIIEKELKLNLKSVSKKYKWSFKDSIIFKIEKGYFFEVIVFYNRMTKNINVRLSFKPLVLDDLFWELFDMHENKKQPLSFRSFGAYTIRAFELSNWQEEFVYNEISLEKLCISVIDNSQKIIDDSLKKLENLNSYIIFLNQLSQEYKAKFPNSVIDINLELALSNISLGNTKVALDIIDKRLEVGDTGRFIDSRNSKTIGIYEYIKKYCESNNI